MAGWLLLVLYHIAVSICVTKTFWGAGCLIYLSAPSHFLCCFEHPTPGTPWRRQDPKFHRLLLVLDPSLQDLGLQLSKWPSPVLNVVA